MRPRVLIFSTAYLPLVGGAEVAVKEITDRLPEIDFELITARFKRSLPRQEKIGRVLVRRVGWGWPTLDKYWLALWGARLAARRQRQEPYQAIWAIMASYGGWAAKNFKQKFPTVPFILTLQEGDDLAYIARRVGIWKNGWQKIFKLADRVQVISHYLGIWAEAQGVPAEKISIIPNGVTLENFPFQPKDISAQPVIITTSRLVPKNGVADLITALTFLPAPVQLLVVGDGPLEIELKNLVKRLNLDARVTFVGGVKPEKIPEFLAQADIFCRPSLSEGLGNSFLEAMAVGRPVIGTPVGGIPDFLMPDETGWLARPQDPESIAMAIKQIVDPAQTELVRRIVKQARNMVEERYPWERIVVMMNALFHDLWL